MLALCVGAALGTDRAPRVVDIRIGHHAEFDRLVLELEGPAPLRELRDQPGEPLVLEIEAQPLMPHQTLETPYARLGTIEIERSLGGVRIRLGARPRRVRAYRLEDPARIVLDLADPGPDPFELPPGVEPLRAPARATVTPSVPTSEAAETASVPTAEVAETPSVPTSEVEETPPVPSSVDAPPAPAVEARSGEAPQAAGEPNAAAVPEEAESPAPPVELEQPPAPQTTTERSTERRAQGTEAPAAPTPSRPPVTPPASAEPPWFSLLGLGAVTGLTLLLLIALGIALLAWLRMARVRSRRQLATLRSSALEAPRSPETITPEEIAVASDRVDLLEKRIDEEVRARMQLEEHVRQLGEDLKVLHDRVLRLGRRGEGSG